MRISTLLFVVCLLLFCIRSGAQPEGQLLPFNSIHGKLMFKQRYCGGARPPEELLAMLDSLRPLPNTTVYLTRKKEGKFLYKLVSDKDGNFKKRMRAGKYFVYMSRDYDQVSLSNFNPSCEKWMKKIFAEIEITNREKKGYEIDLHFGCDPCSPPRP